MKRIVGYFFAVCFLVITLQSGAQAGFDFTETWSVDLRSQVTVECSEKSIVCEQLCNNARICVLKNSICKDCISTGIKMTYFFSAFGKDITSSNNKVTIYEFIDFLINEKFIAFSANNVYNQFDSVQSDALAKRFKSMCPNDYETPMAFFSIQNKELEIQNARYVACGDSVYKLEINSSLLD